MVCVFNCGGHVDPLIIRNNKTNHHKEAMNLPLSENTGSSENKAFQVVKDVFFNCLTPFSWIYTSICGLLSPPTLILNDESSIEASILNSDETTIEELILDEDQIKEVLSSLRSNEFLLLPSQSKLDKINSIFIQLKENKIIDEFKFKLFDRRISQIKKEEDYFTKINKIKFLINDVELVLSKLR